MADVPENAPSHCPGTKSEHAGKTSACAGCPNKSICASGVANQPDPALGEIKLRLASVKHKILVLSGKGGVGKSTVTSHLAYAFAENPDKQVAILDVDICGPSQPVILGVQNEQVHQSATGWSPVYVRDNLSVMSVGFLLPSVSDAVIWRGPRKNGIIKQFLKDVDWTGCLSNEDGSNMVADTTEPDSSSGPSLDYLVIDTPPGTSDEHMTIISLLIDAGLMSSSSLDGAILVTTPQEVALLDVRKQIDFCRRLNLPILGVVENMAGFVCPKCHNRTEIFAPTSGGAATMCEKFGLNLLGSIPLHKEVALACDTGRSFLEASENAAHAPVIDAFRNIVNQVKKIVGESS